MTDVRDRFRTWRWWIASAGALAVLGVVLVALAPMIVSATLLSGLVRDAVAGSVRGSVTVSAASVSWSGPQQVAVRIEDDGGVIDANATIDASLIGLLRGTAAPVVTLAGSLETNYRHDGSLTISELFVKHAPSGEAPERGIQSAGSRETPFALPGLARHASLKVSRLDLRAKSLDGGPTISIESLSGQMALNGTDAQATIAATSAIGSERGTIAMEGRLTNAFTKDGALDLPRAAMDLSIKASALPIAAGAQWVVVRQLNLSATSESIAKSLALEFDAQIEAQGTSAAASHGNVRVLGLLTPSGTMSAKATASGSVALRSVPTSIAAPFLAGSGVDLARDVGPMLDATIDFDGGSATLAARTQHIAITARGRLDDATNQAVIEQATLDAQLTQQLLASVGVPSAADVPLSLRVDGARVPLTGDALESLQAVVHAQAPDLALTGIPGTGDSLRLGQVSLDVRTAKLGDRVQIELSCVGGEADGTLACFVIPKMSGASWAGGRLDLTPSTIGFVCDDPLIASTGAALRRPVRAELAIRSLSVPLSASGIDLKSLQCDATLRIPECSLSGVLGEGEWLDASATTVGVGVTNMMEGARLSVQGGLSGFGVTADLMLTRLLGADGAITTADAQAKGSVQVDAIDLARIPHVPEQSQRLSGLVGLGRPVLNAELTASHTAATAKVSLRGPAASLQAMVDWSPHRVRVTKLAGTVTVSDGLPELLGVDGLRIAEAASVTVSGEDLELLTPTPTPVAIELRATKLELGLDRLSLSECPGVVGPLVLERVSVSGDLTRSGAGDLMWKGGFRSSMPGELDASGQAALDLPSTGTLSGSASLHADIANAAALSKRLGTAALASVTISPGTLDLDWKRTAGVDAVHAKASWARAELRGELGAGGSPLAVALSDMACDVSIASLAEGASVRVGSQVSLDGAAAHPATLRVDLRGDLRGVLDAAGTINIGQSSIELEAPGALLQPLITNSASPATAAAPKPGTATDALVLAPGALVKARAELNRVSWPTRAADASVDAVLTIGPLDATASGESVHVQQTRLVLKAPALGRSCTFDGDASFGKTGAGTLTAKGTIESLGTAEGAIGLDRVVASVQAKANAVPLAWVDAVCATGGDLARVCGPLANASLTAVSPKPGTIECAVSVDTDSFDATAPRVRIVDGFVQVDPDQPLALALTLNDAIRGELLASVNPILGDVREAPPLRGTVSMLRWPIDGNLVRLDGDALLEVGQVTVVKGNELLGFLKLAKASAEPTVPAIIGPLKAAVRAGQLKYQDFKVGVGRTGNEWQLYLDFSGDIDLARTPPYARAIKARYPLSSIVRTAAGATSGISGGIDGTIAEISNALASLPIDLGNLLAVDVTFSGPLDVSVEGSVRTDTPLAVSVHPVVGKIDPLQAIDSAGQLLDGLFGDKNKKKNKQGAPK